MLTDTHCHLNSPVFFDRVGEVVARAEAAGVGTIIVPGWDRESSLQALALAAAFPAICPAVGLHPWFVTAEDDLTWWREMVQDPRVVAVGEIGLDWAATTDHAAQEAVFCAQLQVARERDLPVLLHCRRGWDVLLRCLQACPLRGVVHAFSGSLEVMQACLRLGLFLSFGGMVTRPNSHRAQQAAAAVPGDYLLLETDAPYMAQEGVLAEESEPAHIPYILDFVAHLRGEARGELAGRVEGNVGRLFG